VGVIKCFKTRPKVIYKSAGMTYSTDHSAYIIDKQLVQRVGRPTKRGHKTGLAEYGKGWVSMVATACGKRYIENIHFTQCRQTSEDRALLVKKHEHGPQSG